MFNVCVRCGIYRADKTISADGRHAICPECGQRHAFLRLPLLLVSGASGAGKSTACHHLLGREPSVVLLDSDILWRPEFDQPETDYRDFFELWLRMCKNIGQSGRPVVLFGAGVGVPENLEPCIERRYFATLHYLALVCDDDELIRRLRARPAWRNSSREPFIEEQVRFNRWFKAHARSGDSPIALLDTTELSVQETAASLQAWIQACLTQSGSGTLADERPMIARPG